MLTTDPHYALVMAHEHGRQLNGEAATRRLCRRSGTRRALAASLRHAADRLDQALLAPRPA
jgi:hypothetical protein